MSHLSSLIPPKRTVLRTTMILFFLLLNGCNTPQEKPEKSAEGPGLLKNYVKIPLDKAKKVSDMAESRNDEYDKQLESLDDN
jgi:hypothetical protein